MTLPSISPSTAASAMPLLFECHPDPMWIYDAETLRFLAVNDAAVEKYGYPREAFLQLGLRDIRSAEEAPALEAALERASASAHAEARVFEHRVSGGGRIMVEIRSSAVRFEGRGARLVVARDVSHVLKLESERRLLIRRERESREAAEAAALLFRTVFEALPGKFLVLSADDDRIVAVSDDYLGATLTQRHGIEGRPLFEAFPSDPAEPAADGEHALRASLDRVKSTGETDIMGVQRYPIRRPDGRFEERFWSPVNTPVRGPDGKLQYIIHRVEDVTEVVRAPHEPAREAHDPRIGMLELDVVLRTRELKKANLLLSQRDVLLRNAQQLINMGTWDLDLAGESLHWTENVFRIYGLDPAGFEPSMAAVMSCTHPQDVEQVSRAHREALSRRGHMDISHRILRADGQVRTVRQVADIVRTAEGERLVGVIQDVSEAAAAQAEADRLLRRLRDTFDSIGDAFFILDRGYRLAFMNGEAERLMQASIEELGGQRVFAAERQTPAALVQALDNAFAGQRPVDVEVDWPATGAWYAVRVYPTSDGLAVYLRDVTQHRKMQEELLLLKSAVDRQSDILLITQADSIDHPHGPRIVYVNDAFTRRTGYAPDEVIGQTPRLLQGGGTSRSELDRIRKALSEQRPVRAELLNYNRDGEELWLEIDIAPVTDGAGRLTHWVAVERDVTERKEVERRARLNEERFQLVARATNDVIWDWDLQTDTLWWNDAFDAAFGYDRSQVDPSSASWSDRIHAGDRDTVLARIRTVIDGDATHWSDEYRFLKADGQVVEVIDRGFLIRDDAGRATRMIGSMVDVTELRRLEDQLRRAQRLDALGQLTGGLAHDFNNLLTVILGNAEMLSEQLASQADLKALAETTVHAAARGAELTSRLLAFARKQALRPALTDVNQLVTSLHDLAQRTLGENIEVHLRRQPALWLAHVDAAQLESALLNLCINARDAMPMGGRLEIETINHHQEADEASGAADEGAAAGDYVVIRVSDNGEGMDAQTLARAFEPFFTTKEVGKGSGLGLSMVYGFARQSHGFVRIESQPGRGTTARLAIPRADSAAAPPLSAPAEVTAGGRENVLLVEDNPLVQQHVHSQLASLGYRVRSVGNASEAVAELQQHPYDLLFTDIVMPGGVNGWQLARQARDLQPGIAVLLTSGDAGIQSQAPALADAALMLFKPYRRAELAGKVRRALDAARAARAESRA